jgi:hypothetical protein
MRIRADIPSKAQLINGGFPCRVAPKGQSWPKSQLGDYSDKKGVYILHSNGQLLYVGKTTDGDFGNFGDRLYRHFSESASNNSRVYRLLAQQKESIRAYLLDLMDIDMMIDPGRIGLNEISEALIMEQILIGVFNPIGNNPKAVNDN